MSILPQLERDLHEAAERRLRAASEGVGDNESDGKAWRSATRTGLRERARRLRVPALAFGCLLATTTIALAATGVILTGAPVRPQGPLNPNAGEGVPAAGASQLLPLRVPDPEGGLPWGVRIVHTTRGEVCVQIGRVANGQLGELGIDGVFHDDGRFHPISPAVLPETSGVGKSVEDDAATESVSCELAGHAIAGEHVGVDRSAGAANGDARAIPRGDLRDLYYGLLGADAVSVSFREGTEPRSEAVLPPLGAYLLVRRIAPHQHVGVGEESIGTEGDLAPEPPITAITYRLDGRLCQRGPTLPPWVTSRLADPCPFPHWPSSRYVAPRDLRQPLRVRLQISHRLITAVELSFTAPLAVTSANADYDIRIPSVSCVPPVPGRGPGARAVGATGYTGQSIERDIARGAIVTQSLSAYGLFAGVCGGPREPRPWTRRVATIEVLYAHPDGEVPVLVGTATVREPAGASPAPPAAGPLRRHR
ncbi:MAG: hypothetical protein ABSG93_06675 [Solirubrobacteraceae bacterium]|jgi:hypothetical protein